MERERELGLGMEGCLVAKNHIQDSIMPVDNAICLPPAKSLVHHRYVGRENTDEFKHSSLKREGNVAGECRQAACCSCLHSWHMGCT